MWEARRQAGAEPSSVYFALCVECQGDGADRVHVVGVGHLDMRIDKPSVPRLFQFGAEHEGPIGAAA